MEFRKTKEGMMKIGFELTEADKEMSQVAEQLQRTVTLLEQMILKRKHRVKRDKIVEQDDDESDHFVTMVTKMHEILRSNILANIEVYNDFSLLIKMDQFELSDRLRKLQCIKKEQKYSYYQLKKKHSISENELKTLRKDFEEVVKKNLNSELEEAYYKDGEIGMKSAASSVNRQLGKRMKEYFLDAQKRENELRRQVEKFWFKSSKDKNKILEEYKEDLKKYPTLSHFKGIFFKFQKGEFTVPRDKEKTFTTVYRERPDDFFNPQKLSSCGFNLEYTHLNSDYENDKEQDHFEMQEQDEKDKRRWRGVGEEYVDSRGYLSDETDKSEE